MPLTSQEKKKYLQQYGKLNKEIDRQLEEITRLKALAEKATTTLSGMPKGTSDKDDTYIRLIDLRGEVNDKIDQYVDMRKEIVRAIDTVEDLTLRTLLSRRYINGETWEQVAVNMNYCYMQICRLHGKALESIRM
jgi:DNA-directed RNA polymerase specialized sigma subunit